MVLLGVQPAQTGWGDTLSREVEAALPRLIQAALEELEQWTLETTPPDKYQVSDKNTVPSPVWYPTLSKPVRQKLFALIRAVLKAERFDPALINQYCGR